MARPRHLGAGPARTGLPSLGPSTSTPWPPGPTGGSCATQTWDQTRSAGQHGIWVGRHGSVWPTEGTVPGLLWPPPYTCPAAPRSQSARRGQRRAAEPAKRAEPGADVANGAGVQPHPALGRRSSSTAVSAIAPNLEAVTQSVPLQVSDETSLVARTGSTRGGTSRTAHARATSSGTRSVRTRRSRTACL